MRTLLPVIAAVFWGFTALAQPRSIVWFTDKGIHPKPAVLSDAALERRLKQNILPDFNDLEIDPGYEREISKAGLTINGRSRWLNALLVTGDAEQIRHFQFVKHITPLTEVPAFGTNISSDTLHSDRNVVQHNGKALYEKGLRGKGKHIAVFDAGFTGVDSAGAFSHLFREGKLQLTRDYVNGTGVFNYSEHGTYVLSCMAGLIAGEYAGSAVEARYSLFVTENVFSETLAEEFNWVMAAEAADSLGVDIITSSLSYTTFDDSSANHTFEDLDGKTTIAAKGAAVAASKGILVLNSAGNLRTEPWKKIATPADADSIITVGAVDGAGKVAPFSSPGPTADGRIKPEVCGLGFQTALINRKNEIFAGNGTSFSTPVISGLCASLWQAFPDMTAQQIRTLVMRSSHNYSNPDNDCGYGSPNFMKALVLGGYPEDEVLIYPNPSSGRLFVQFGHLQGEVKAVLYNDLGQKTAAMDLHNISLYEDVDLGDLLAGPMRRGIYHLVLTDGKKEWNANLLLDM